MCRSRSSDRDAFEGSILGFGICIRGDKNTHGTRNEASPIHIALFPLCSELQLLGSNPASLMRSACCGLQVVFLLGLFEVFDSPSGEFL